MASRYVLKTSDPIDMNFDMDSPAGGKERGPGEVTREVGKAEVLISIKSQGMDNEVFSPSHRQCCLWTPQNRHGKSLGILMFILCIL